MQERTYLRPGGSPGWGVKGLAAAFVTALGVFVFWGSPAFPEALGLVPSRAFPGLELWRFFSAPFWFGSLAEVRIAPFVLSVLCFFVLGAPLERWLGSWRIAVLVGAALFLGHLGAGLLGLALAPDEALGGPAPGAWAVITALCINYWSHQTLVIRPLPLRGRHLFCGLAAALLVALLWDLKDGLSPLPFVADALGGAVGALFVTKGWRPGRRRRGARSRFVVLTGGADGPASRPPAGGRKGNGRGSPGSKPKAWN
ncbi:MAG: rhomboid family intramembrane serine protease [Polyangia bacterium]|jgi:hypothetical protein|nr:rhomboid family intramembrane serine protease [Polyangia bacterium]